MYGRMAQAPPTSRGDIVMPLSLQSMNNGVGQVPFHQIGFEWKCIMVSDHVF
jgi:hypothetical protein